MSKRADKKKKKKDKFVIRIAKDAKRSFLEVCESLESSAGKEIRRLMRGFVGTHAEPTAAEEGENVVKLDLPNVTADVPPATPDDAERSDTVTQKKTKKAQTGKKDLSGKKAK